MIPDQLPPRMRPRPPSADRYSPEPYEPPGAATLNIPDRNRGLQPSTGPHPAVPQRSLSHRTYLSPVQSHPHSTVLSHTTAKLQIRHVIATQQVGICVSDQPFPALNCSLFPSNGAHKFRGPEQFNCQIRTQFSPTS